jgi:hypothetical protein
MKKALILITVLLALSATLYSFTIKSASGRFEASLGPVESLTTGFEMQAIYNTNETFYVGVRFMTGNQFFYYSAVSGPSQSVGYLNSYSDISMVLGAQFVQFNERFNMFFNLLPGFAFATRDRGVASTTTYGAVTMPKVLESETPTFFSPAFELGFSANLTDNLIISTGWVAKLVAVKDMEWKHYPWLIKLGEKDAFNFCVPVRLIWRF